MSSPRVDQPGEAIGEAPANKPFLFRGVFSVGLSSLFSDTGHEITTAMLPSLVTGVLRGSAGALGLIEGISDAILGVATLGGGMLANDEHRRLRLARGGYVSMAIATGLIAFAVTLWQVAVLRAAAWLARGLRSPARDSILTSLTPRQAYGRAFGIERAGDNLGAVAGPLIAAGLVAWLGIRPTLFAAAFPALLAAVAITVAAAELRKLRAPIHRKLGLNVRALRASGLSRPLLPVVMFEIANVSTTLLILRATDLLEHGGRGATAATSLAVVLYAGHNAVAAAVAYGAGYWIDARGPRIVFAAGAVSYVAGYAAFALPLGGWPAILGAFALAGAGIGFAEAAESTLVARILLDDLRSAGFGVLGAIQSSGGLASSAVAGLVWVAFSPALAFVYVACWMALSAVASVGTRVMKLAD